MRLAPAALLRLLSRQAPIDVDRLIADRRSIRVDRLEVVGPPEIDLIYLFC